MEEGRPLDASQLLRQSQYLLWLFRHDNWVERNNNPQALSRVHARILGVLQNSSGVAFTEAEYRKDFDISDGDTIDKKEYDLLKAFLRGIADIGDTFYRAFSRQEGSMGFADFSRSVARYLRAQVSEATHREARKSGADISSDLARRVRQEACGVYTVNYAALAECKFPIPRTVYGASSEIGRIEQAFSALICHFNDAISAFREVNDPNWTNNELYLLATEMLGDGEEELTIAHYKKAVAKLFEKITRDISDAVVDIDALQSCDFGNEKEEFNREIFPLLVYVAVVQQWGIGSIPAQMALDRYSKHRADGPYIKPGTCLMGENDFWQYAAPLELLSLTSLVVPVLKDEK